MDVTRYIFQSPFSSQVQIGRPDESTTTKEKPQKDGSSEIIKTANESLKNTETLKVVSSQETQPAVSSQSILDLYV